MSSSTKAHISESPVKNKDLFLVERARKGDNRAFELLVRQYQGKVASVIAGFIRDPDKVPDLTQETFISAYRAMGNFRGDATFYTWLYRIAVNTAKNHLVLSGKGVPINDVELEAADRSAPQLRDNETPERRVLRQEMMDRLQAAIGRLGPNMKDAILLRDVEGFSYEEIAERMGCPVGTVRSRIFRGRQSVVDQLQDYLGYWEKYKQPK